MRVVAWVGGGFIVFFATVTIALASSLGGAGASSYDVVGSIEPGTAGLDAEQRRNAEIGLRVAAQEQAPPLAVLALLVAAFGESQLRVVPNASGSIYCGVWQADPRNISCDDVAGQAHYFLRGGRGFRGGGAIYLATSSPGMSPGAIATTVEAGGASSSFYDRYADQAAQIIAAWRVGSGDPKLDGGQLVGPVGSGWLATVPGTAFQCDQRIVGDVSWLILRYHVALTACYAPTGHELNGEHPLGLAVDLIPGPGGSWDDVDQLARDVGWTRACGPSGVRPACPLVPWVRFVGYDGYPGHGRGNHLHISWAHGPGNPAETVITRGG